MKNHPHPDSRSRLSAWLLAITLGAGVATQGLVGKPDKPDKPAASKGKGHGVSDDFTPPGHSERTPPGLVNKGGIPPGLQRAPVEIRVDKAPPALRPEKMLPRPPGAVVWVPGYWQWESAAYVWVPGGWIAPPEPAAVWVPPRHEIRSGVTLYISGYWKL